MNETTKIVDFASWCRKCKYRRRKEEEEPCSSCLDEPCRKDSRKPAKWEKADGR